MELQDLRRPVYIITVEGKPMKLRCSLNALDYLEQTCGGLSALSGTTEIVQQKHMVRAFLFCNYPENAEAFEAGLFEDLKPSLYQVGEWFDTDTIPAVTAELMKIAMESVEAPEDENRLGESSPLVKAALDAIGALSKLCGRENLKEAWRIFGTAPHGR